MISVDYSITMEKDAKNKPKAKDRKLHILKQEKRISSGRITKPPKRIMSTSSDQNHKKKLPKLSQPAVNMRSAINEPSLDTKKHLYLVKNVQHVEGPVDESVKNVLGEAPFSIKSEELDINDILQPAFSENDNIVLETDVHQDANNSPRLSLPTINEKHCGSDEQNTSSSSCLPANHVNHNVLYDLRMICNHISTLATNIAELQYQNVNLHAQNQTLIEEVLNVKKEITSLRAELAPLNAKEDELDRSILQPPDGFPLTTLAQFEELESEKGKQKRRMIYNHLLKMGALNVRSFLNNAMKETMADQLVSCFTWNGTSGMRDFKSTKLSNILYTTARECKSFKGPNNRAGFIVHMKEIIRVTKQRYRNSLKRMQVVGDEQGGRRVGKDARNDVVTSDDETEEQDRNDSQSDHGSNANENSDDDDEERSSQSNQYVDSDIEIFHFNDD